MTMRINSSTFRPAFALVMAIAPLSTDSRGSSPTPPPSALLVEESRSVQAKPGSWELEYRLRWRGDGPLRVPPNRVTAELRGWVANSRAPGHAEPRLSTLALSLDSERRKSTAELIASAAEPERCREHARLAVWLGEGPVPAESANPVDEDLEITPGQAIRFRIALEHEHFLCGTYEPLLGKREILLRLGDHSCAVAADLSEARGDLLPAPSLEAPPQDRLDNSQYFSAPDSLHLEAHAPGCQYYRFKDQQVRYDTEMRLSFWYLVAHGTQGCGKARLTQYQDGPGTSWTSLPRGGVEVDLETAGRWTRVERTFRTLPNATSVGLDFRIVGSDIGEAWIDDVRLEPTRSVVVTP